MRNIPHKLFPLFVFVLLLFIFTPKTAFAAFPWSPWYRPIGLDARDEKGQYTSYPGRLVDFVPISALPNRFASLPGQTGGTGMPGIFFSGNNLPYFRDGKASDPSKWEWQAEDILPNNTTVSTSYASVLAALNRAGTPPLSDVDIPGLDINNLPGPGNYIFHGDTTIDVYIDPTNNSITLGGGNYIILVEGNLYIKSDINVPIGSTAIFSASEDILVYANDAKHTDIYGADTIEGLYSADCRFITDKCTCGTKTGLDINGTVIANAGRRVLGTCAANPYARSEGYFANLRTLDWEDASGNKGFENCTTPSVIFNERPDFILNYPDILKGSNSYWQEVAP